MRRLLSFLVLLALVACSQKGWNDRLATPDEQRLVLQIAEQLRQGQDASIVAMTRPDFRAEAKTAVANVQPILKQAPGPFTIETIGVLQQMGGPSTKSFNLQVGAGTHWAAVEIVLQGRPGSWQLAGFHVWPSNSEPAKLNDFDIGRRGLIGFVWIAMMLASAATCVTAVFLIWRSHWLKRRWLWTLGSLFGFAGFGLNWSTGAWAILFVNISLFGASATKGGPFAPWLMSFGIPIVAMIVIRRWFRDRRSGHGAADAFE